MDWLHDLLEFVRNHPLLVFVVIVQVFIFGKCWRFTSKDESSALHRLGKDFKRDIIGRARRGDGPDWVRYMDEADRVHERKVDKLRTWAMSALVVGIGGTMLALAFRLSFIFSESSEAAGQTPFFNDSAVLGLIEAIGSALWLSLSGVLNNLAISWILFPRSDSRFGTSLDEFRDELRWCCEENPPKEKFGEAVRQELGNAFREAVRTFPYAFAQLDKSVKSLGDIIATQSEAVLKAAGELGTAADGLTGAAARIGPAAELLQKSTDQLRDVPTQFGRMFKRTLAIWREETRRDLDALVKGVRAELDRQHALLESTKDAFDEWEGQRSAAAAQQREHWNETISQVQASASEISKTVQGLPATFSREVGRVADTLGRQFGLQAQQHVAELIEVVSGEEDTSLRRLIENTSKEMHTRFLNETSDVVARAVARILEEVYQRVEGTLLDSLDEVGRGIKEALVELPANAQTFASSLSSADKKLRQSIDRITASANHLKRVAALTEGFEKSMEQSMAVALRDAATPSVRRLENQVRKYIAEMQRTHKSIERALRNSPTGVKRPFRFFHYLSDKWSQLRGRD